MWVPIKLKREKNPYTRNPAWKPDEGWYVFDTKLLRVVHADRLFPTKRLCWLAIMEGTGGMISKAKLMKLDDFIEESLSKSRISSNAYVAFPGFSALYVRVARHMVEGKLTRTIDLASMETRYKGKGSFKKLFAHLRSQWTELPIFVENVLSDRLCEGLLRMGFKEVKEYGPPPSFYFSAEANTCALKEG